MTCAICIHQLSSTCEPMFDRSLQMKSRRQPNGISCVTIIMRSVMQIARIRMQCLWFTEAMIRASSSSSLFCAGFMSPFRTLIATGIFTDSFCGTHQPCTHQSQTINQHLMNMQYAAHLMNMQHMQTSSSRVCWWWQSCASISFLYCVTYMYVLCINNFIIFYSSICLCYICVLLKLLVY